MNQDLSSALKDSTILENFKYNPNDLIEESVRDEDVQEDLV